MVIDVMTADLAIGKYPDVIKTTGIGSCVAICLYDATTKIGGLAHVMLPYHHEHDTNKLRYADFAIETMVAELKKKGVSTVNLVAKIYGGANMFPSLWSGKDSVGTTNIEASRKILGLNKIRIIEEDVGGSSGRSLEFELEHGKVGIENHGK